MVTVTIPLLWAAASYCLLISLLGSTANLIALICIAKNRHLNEGMKVILFNVFIPSFIMSSVMMPLFFYLFMPPSIFRDKGESEGDVDAGAEAEAKEEYDCGEKIRFPNVFFGFLCAFTLMELLGLSLVSIYRLLAISSPKLYHVWISIKRTVILSVVSSVFSILLMSCLFGPKLIAFDVESCSFGRSDRLAPRIIVSLIYGIPLIQIIACLLVTRVKIHQQHLKLQSIRSSTHSLHDTRININNETLIPQNAINPNPLSRPSTSTSDSTTMNESILLTPDGLSDDQQNLGEGSKSSNQEPTTKPFPILYKKDSYYKKRIETLVKYYTNKISPSRKEARRFIKATNRIWIIFVVFTFTNVPHVFVHFIFIRHNFMFVFVVIHLIYWSHLVIDPLIYIILNKKDIYHFISQVKCSCKNANV
ncbi:UNVERIFIED_CONTAM: hypothetical protein RMT77_019366 [Armadillidium vulgare]